MKWYAISGSWRNVNEEVKTDVRNCVRDILRAGNGIVTGGALGVDFLAAEEMLRVDPAAQHIKVILPTSLDTFIRHHLDRAVENVIRQEQAEDLAAQLMHIKSANPDALIEMSFQECTQQTYYARNTAVIDAADALMSFQVNDSLGVQDTIDKARARGLTITQRQYFID